MKKIIMLILSLSLSLFLVSCGSGDGMRRAQKNDLADPGDPIYVQVSDLLKEYVGEGQYTKLTTLSYDESAANYHAGANARQRRTYYDETANALLMGNYDGGFTSINSGYAKVESDMWHYSHDLDEVASSNLFSQDHMNHNYTVQETSPNKFFDNLSALSTAALNETTLSRWDLTDGVYTYTAPEPATINESSYTNGLLKVFQYFCAPMLLLNNSIGLQSVTIQETSAIVNDVLTNVLLIELFDSSHVKISEAIIAKGLTMVRVHVWDDIYDWITQSEIPCGSKTVYVVDSGTSRLTADQLAEATTGSNELVILRTTAKAGNTLISLFRLITGNASHSFSQIKTGLTNATEFQFPNDDADRNYWYDVIDTLNTGESSVTVDAEHLRNLITAIYIYRTINISNN